MRKSFNRQSFNFSMQIKEVSSQGLRRSYLVTVTAQQVAEQTAIELAELSHRVKVPGFRPGKIPLPVMKQRYGQSVLGDVLDKTVRRASSKAIADNNLRPAMQPSVDIKTFAEGKDLEFTVDVDVLPDIPTIDLEAIALNGYEIALDDSRVEESLKKLAENNQTFAPLKKARAAKNGDQVTIDFLGKVGGVAFDGGKGENFKLILGGKRMIPGFEEAIVGFKAGEEKDINVVFPQDYNAKNLAGKDAVFTIKVHSIEESVETNLDDGFAKQFNFDSLDELRTKIRENLQQEYVSMSRSHLKMGLLDHLDGAFDFDLPQSLVDAEFEAVKQSSEHDHHHAEGETCGHDAEWRSLAARRVKLGLILADIGTRNKIEVSDEEVRSAILRQAFQSGNPRMVMEYYEKNPQAIQSVRAPLYEDKIADYMLDTVQVKRAPIDLEAFTKLLEEEEAAEKPAKPAKKKAAPKTEADADEKPEVKAKAAPKTKKGQE